ncbi:DUF2553 family protein [Priestia taiwanensis]|uniref:DUF2553 family protein n=1 Tax=Priestia taiwanensis TaxID=1347902 RepID=A0A917AV37_9BACI|nr:DUF2553 family protein [Priestia taiwanensis]MBM7363375.1 hypothetical protein [Priestia taiwanensis]GGE77690.1 hypothetical protein GCM10007140_29170 [Priestia taiwanensis]
MKRILKIDITDNVVAKFKESYLEVYLSGFCIGKYHIDIDEKKAELTDGYIYEKGRFYKVIDIGREERSYVEDGYIGW